MRNKKTLIMFIIVFIPFLLGSAPSPTRQYEGKGFSFSLSNSYRLVEEDDNYFALASPYSILKVYTEELKKGVSAHTYIEYGNVQLYKGKANFNLIKEDEQKKNGYTIRQISYSRPKIKNLPDDKNYYLEVHIVNREKNRVVSFWGKTSQVFFCNMENDLNNAVKSFVEKEYTVPPISRSVGKDLEQNQLSPHIKYTGRNVKLEIKPHELLWGRFYPGVPFYENSYNKMLGTEKSLDHKFELLMTYCSFPVTNPFPADAIRKVYQDGRVLMLTLQPFTQDLNWIAVPEIIAGEHDTVIREWAEGLKKIGDPVFVRPLNEMNGDWDPWCAWFFGKDTDLYIRAWRHIVEIFREVGADNVLFVWNPHDRSYPDFAWNNSHRYYPGNEYVDWVGLTGYNNGTSHSADVWREFDEIYRPLYDDYYSRYPEKPFMITEFSCNEVGGDKSLWIERGMVSLAKNYPNIKIAVWFDARDNEWLYQLDSSPQAFNAFKNSLNNFK